jgi:hypothetical protein
VKSPFFQHLDEGTRCARVPCQARAVGGTGELRNLEEANLSGVGSVMSFVVARR